MQKDIKSAMHTKTSEVLGRALAEDNRIQKHEEAHGEVVKLRVDHGLRTLGLSVGWQ